MQSNRNSSPTYLFTGLLNIHDNKLRCKIAKKGRDKYFKYFNSTIVADYIVNKTIGTKRRFFWENV